MPVRFVDSDALNETLELLKKYINKKVTSVGGVLKIPQTLVIDPY